MAIIFQKSPLRRFYLEVGEEAKGPIRLIASPWGPEGPTSLHRSEEGAVDHPNILYLRLNYYNHNIPPLASRIRKFVQRQLFINSESSTVNNLLG